jgi:ABC-type multidrug transport system, ATPase component
MTKPMIIADQISKNYGRKHALDRLSLSIESGHVTGILGANGAGKSTFFRMVTGLVTPNHGQLTVFGRKPGWRINSQIAYLPDRARWYSNYTAEQSFDFGTKVLPGFDLNEALRLADLMKLPLQLKTGGMSKGQEARLMLTLCIARNVPLIVLDEPFSGIDGSSRERIMEALVDAISERRQTLLISTHEIYEAEGLLDDVFFLSEGHVQLSGAAEQLRAQYGSIYELSRKLGD